jgi:aryl-alcohol dehydrogenase-like predicted oxidoreductase
LNACGTWGYIFPMPRRANTSDSATSRPVANVRASDTGSRRYAARWEQRFVSDFFRKSHSGLSVSSLALGTYLGESDDATDALYADAARLALSSGVNMIDTAINYRCQRSERVIGRVLQELIGEGVLRRDEVVICTKAGYVPLDGNPPASREQYEAYLRREYFESGVLRPDELVGGGHAMTPAFLIDQLHRSMRNLGVQAIDYFYIHNPEQQLAGISSAEFTTRIRLAFEALESCVSRGLIGCYGCATWSGLRLPAASQGHLSLYELAAIAKEAGGADHHFRIVQLPINLTMSEAVRVSTQRDSRGRLVHVIDAAAELGIDLVVSAPLLQGQLTHDLPEQVRELFAGATDAQRALAFVRTLPAVIAAAVGMKSTAHVTENLASLRVA